MSITLHHDGHGLNERIDIQKDGPGPGGASHEYTVFISGDGEIAGADFQCAKIQFQRGPRYEAGSTPGITDRVLYAILIDRLEAFQAGPYACAENKQQLAYLRHCLACSKMRADERAKRGVLGTTKE